MPTANTFSSGESFFTKGNKSFHHLEKEENNRREKNKTSTTESDTLFKVESENLALQHKMNKLKQYHGRAFEFISRALKIDEEYSARDSR